MAFEVLNSSWLYEIGFFLGAFQVAFGNIINRPDYLRKDQLKLLNDFAISNNLSQLVDFCTWSRTINGIKKESILDHVYVNNPAVINMYNLIKHAF